MLFLLTKYPDARSVAQYFADDDRASAESEGRRLAARHHVPYIVVRARDAFDDSPELVATLSPELDK